MNIVLLKKLRENFQIHYRYNDSDCFIVLSNDKKINKSVYTEWIGAGWAEFIAKYSKYFTTNWNTICFEYFLYKHNKKENLRRNFKMYNNSYQASMIRKKLSEDLKRIEKEKIN